jgi:RTX calcium-binding nonapeptide repeat (4 copies)
MQRVGEGAVVRQGSLIAVVVTLLIGCAFLLLVVGCSGTRSEAPKKKEKGRTEVTTEQEHTEATTEQTRSPEATESEEEARCDGTRIIKEKYGGPVVTNDVSGCPKGGLLRGTDGRDRLAGDDGSDEVRGLGGSDEITDGLGKDLVYGGMGGDNLIGYGGDTSLDRFYGGPGDDIVQSRDVPAVKDVVVCGGGTDTVYADKADVGGGGCEREKVR